MDIALATQILKLNAHANLQNIKIELNGSTKKALVCTKCIKGNKVVKAK